jgi:hypothetical protein
LLSAALMPHQAGQYGRTLPTFARFSNIHRMLEIAHRDRSQPRPFKSLLLSLSK